jgi:glycosyltransferase involved in cell wall biosynthesis
MRVLFISPVIPEPPTDGGRQRVHHLLQALVNDYDVFFVGVARSDVPHHWTLAQRFAAAPLFVEMSGSRQISPDDEVEKILGLRRWARPDSFRRFKRTGLWDRLREFDFDKIDVVHVETMPLAPFGLALQARHPHIRSVLDLPDVAWHYNARLLGPRWWMRPRAVRDALDVVRLYRFERLLIPRFDSVIVCSELDGSRLGTAVSKERLHVMPNCTTTGVAVLEPATSRDLVFVGTMSYPPNEEGVLYFCREVLPLIQRVSPETQFWIVGKSPSLCVRGLERTCRGVHVTGEVDDVRPFLSRSAAAVVPLLNGGGTRLKILEAMAAGRAVVSTSVGAEGLHAQHDVHLLLADTPQAMAESCVNVIASRETRERLVRHGRALVEQGYDWHITERSLRSIYAQLVLKDATSYRSDRIEARVRA